ncbi:hypothetical protein [Enterococcus phage vB_Efm_LG62]|uniref:Uncharacterized protein n=1 Tax=Enterococcus phage vB_Efm_LG62 TaxID=2970334 RepID=A0A976XGJ7_9CAUD|nr:hypothetical protein [Enterococcus phage vB_Efm_LG62]
MIGYIILFIVWSLLMVCLGVKMADKDCDNRIEKLERSRDFHKAQTERFVEYSRTIVEENKNLKERNYQLINENKRLKKELDKQGHVTYNYYINKNK